MARPKNQIENVQLRVSLDPKLLSDLELLIRAGGYGANVNEAISRLVSEGVRVALKEAVETLGARDQVETMLEEMEKKSAKKSSRK